MQRRNGTTAQRRNGTTAQRHNGATAYRRNGTTARLRNMFSLVVLLSLYRGIDVTGVSGNVCDYRILYVLHILKLIQQNVDCKQISGSFLFIHTHICNARMHVTKTTYKRTPPEN